MDNRSNSGKPEWCVWCGDMQGQRPRVGPVVLAEPSIAKSPMVPPRAGLTPCRADTRGCCFACHVQPLRRALIGRHVSVSKLNTAKAACCMRCPSLVSIELLQQRTSLLSNARMCKAPSISFERRNEDLTVDTPHSRGSRFSCGMSFSTCFNQSRTTVCLPAVVQLPPPRHRVGPSCPTECGRVVVRFCVANPGRHHFLKRPPFSKEESAKGT